MAPGTRQWWFTVLVGGPAIQQITPTGVVTSLMAGTNAGSAPQGIVAGPDGNVDPRQFKRGIGGAGGAFARQAPGRTFQTPYHWLLPSPEPSIVRPLEDSAWEGSLGT
jgi:hypothetical protein